MFHQQKSFFLLVFLLLVPLTPLLAAGKQAEAPPPQLVLQVNALVQQQDVEGLRALGEKILPILVDSYRDYDENGRANLAWIFYSLGWQSEAAKEAMMADIHTGHKNLRLQVQWALGRVSNDDAVVDALLDNLQRDDNALFREKAACGLASDQIHLTEAQKVRLYQRLVGLLESDSVETRWLAIRILGVQTGQKKGFLPGASPERRAPALAAWKAWLAEYERNSQ